MGLYGRISQGKLAKYAKYYDKLRKIDDIVRNIRNKRNESINNITMVTLGDEQKMCCHHSLRNLLVFPDGAWWN